MKTYNIELFDTRNTALPRRFSGSVYSAKKYAEDLSTKDGVHHVILYGDNRSFEEYEKGEMTSWSYPNGLN